MDGVRTALNTVLSELHKVLYKQLLAWLLQGNLYDPYQGRTSHIFAGIIFWASGSVIICKETDPSINKKITLIPTAVVFLMTVFLYRPIKIYLQKVKSKQKFEKIFFVGILKATEEKNWIRISDKWYGSADMDLCIKIRIRNTAFFPLGEGAHLSQCTHCYLSERAIVGQRYNFPKD